MNTDLSAVVGLQLKRGDRLTRGGMAIAFIFLLLLQSCGGERSLSPMQPSRVSSSESDGREAIECVRAGTRYFRVHPEYDELCAEESIRRGLTTTCKLEYNAQLSHGCSGGWPEPGVSDGVVRVRIALSAFRDSQRFHTRSWLYDIRPGGSTWLCHKGGGMPEPCEIDITGGDLQRYTAGPFELRMRWNACWLQDGVSGEERACNRNPGDPEFPSSPYEGFLLGF